MKRSRTREMHSRICDVIEDVQQKATDEKWLLREAMEHLVMLLEDEHEGVAVALDNLLDICSFNRVNGAPLADMDLDDWQEWEGRNNV